MTAPGLSLPLQHTSPASRLPGTAKANVRQARFKSDFVNKFIRANAVPDLIEFGCGDGRMMQRLRVGAYTGVDASATMLAHCRNLARDSASRRFFSPTTLPADASAAMALSVDMMHRLTGGTEFNAYIRTMFQAAQDFVAIYAGNTAPAWASPASGQRHSTEHVMRFFPAWRLAAHVPNPVEAGGTPPANFFIYARCGIGCVIPAIATF